MEDDPKRPPGLDPQMWYRVTHPYFILDEHGEPVPVDDVLVWGRWIEAHQAEKFLGKTLIEERGLEVSTVFLGLDHTFTFEGPPVLWETMVFHNRQDTFTHEGHTRSYRPSTDHQWRYRTRAAALAGHQQVVQAVREGKDLDDLELEH